MIDNLVAKLNGRWQPLLDLIIYILLKKTEVLRSAGSCSRSQQQTAKEDILILGPWLPASTQTSHPVWDQATPSTNLPPAFV